MTGTTVLWHILQQCRRVHGEPLSALTTGHMSVVATLILGPVIVPG